MNKSWFKYLPHPVIMLLGMLVLAALSSYVIPSGIFDRTEVDGRMMVVAGSFKLIASHPLSLMDMFLSIPGGFKTAADIIFIVISSGIMFGFMQDSGAIENSVGTLIRKLGIKRRYLIVIVMTFIFGALGIFVGYENNIAMIPVACLLSLALGGDLMLAAGMSVGAITVGFGLSPFNPYTIGTGQKLAQLPLFSGALLRSILCFTGLAMLAMYNVSYFKNIINYPSRSLAQNIDNHGFLLSKPLESYSMRNKDTLILISFITGIGIILYGVFTYHWFIQHISAIFCMMAVIIGIINRNSFAECGKITLESVAVVAPGAFMVGLATSIKVALDTAQISDTIAFQLSQMLTKVPLGFAAVGMAIAQTCMNFVIPSGSGQALATLPVMIPAGEVLGMTRQSTILAFQIGDGVSNLVNPSLGGIIAMLSFCRIPFDRWLKFITPFFILLFFISLIFVALSVPLNYGPF